MKLLVLVEVVVPGTGTGRSCRLVVVEPQVDGEGAMEEGIGEAGDVWKVGH